VSLLSRLRAVVSGDDYLDGYDDDDLEYDQGEVPETNGSTRPGALAVSSDFSVGDPFTGTNVIGMPGISSAASTRCPGLSRRCASARP
jgi:cell division inhibitor SepF